MTAATVRRFLGLVLSLVVCSGLLVGCKKDRKGSVRFQEPAISGSIALTAREGTTATALASGVVVVAGGFGESGAALAEVSLIAADDSVSVALSLAIGRARHGAVAIEGGARVAIAGGVAGTSAAPLALASTVLFDPAAGPTAGPDLPAAVREAKVVFWDGGTPADPSDDAVFVIGGRDSAGTPSAAVFRWNLAAGTTALASTLSTARAGHTATLCAGPGGIPLIYVIGGEDSGGPLATTERIDPVAGTVTAGPALPSARTRHAAASVGGCGAVLVVGGLDGSGAGIGSALLLRLTGAAPETFADAGGFGPAVFDLLALTQADGDAAVLGGFTALESGAPARPSKEAALFDFDAAAVSGEFIDLPDIDPSSGAGAAAAAVRPGSALGADGTGSAVVLAGGRGSGGELLAAASYNPFGASAARSRDLTRQVGGERAMLGATLLAVFGMVEKTREYEAGRLRDIDFTRTDDPVLGTVITGDLGEFGVRIELDGGLIRCVAAGETIVAFPEGDRLRSDAMDIRIGDDSASGRYYLSWKRNSLRVDLRQQFSSSHFEGRIAIDLDRDLRNTAVEIEGGGARTDRHRSFVDSRNFDLTR